MDEAQLAREVEEEINHMSDEKKETIIKSTTQSSGPYRVEDGCIVRERQTRDGPIVSPPL